MNIGVSSDAARQMHSTRAIVMLILGVFYVVLWSCFLVPDDCPSCVTETEMTEMCCYPAYRIPWELLIPAWLLVTMAGYSLTTIFARGIRLAVSRKQSRQFLTEIAAALYVHRLEEAVAVSAKYPKSPVAAVIHASLRNLGGTADCARILPSMQDWQRAVAIKTAEIKQRLWSLAAIGRTAPLVGLFYAAARLAQSFWWQERQWQNPSLSASDLAYAIWGLLFGLIVAVPTIWAHKFFTSQVETSAVEMERLSLAIFEQFVDAQKHAADRLRADYITKALRPPVTGRLRD